MKVVDDFRISGLHGARLMEIEPDEWRGDIGFDHVLADWEVDGAVIQNPAPEMVRDVEGQGFLSFYGPRWIRWNKTAETYEDYLGSREDLGAAKRKKKLADYRRKTKRDPMLHVEVLPLSEETFSEWFSVFDTDVLKRDQAVQTIGPDGAAKLIAEEKRKNIEFRLVVIRDRKKVLGGYIVEFDFMAHCATIKYGAFLSSDQPEQKNIGLVCYDAFVRNAMKSGIQTFSYGLDANFFGYGFTVGLHQFKSVMGFQPEPGRAGFAGDRLILLPAEQERTRITYIYKSEGPAIMAATAGAPMASLSFPKGFEPAGR